MSYLVMECNPAYAVVLDEEGRFIKVANLQYEVGQRVEEVIEMQIPQAVPAKNNMKRWISSIAAVAACFMLIIAGTFYTDQSSYASVYMTINPQIRIDVNRRDKVVGVEGVNEDGKALVSDYDYKKKTLEIVMDELVDLAVEMDFLHEGGKVTLTFDSKSNEWVVKHSDSLKNRLSDHINDRLTVTVEVADRPEEGKVVIPVSPEREEYNDSDYGEVITEATTPVESQSGHEPKDENNNGITDYGNTDFDEDESDYDDAESDYTDESPSASDYDESDDDPESDYDETVIEEDAESDYDGDDNDDDEEDDDDNDDEEDDEDSSDYDD